MYIYICFPGGTSDKVSACQCKRLKRHGFNPWVGKIPWGRKWQPTLVLSPGKFHGWRILVGYSPWGYKESDNNTQACAHMHTHTHTHTHTPHSFFIHSSVDGYLSRFYILDIVNNSMNTEVHLFKLMFLFLSYI